MANILVVMADPRPADAERLRGYEYFRATAGEYRIVFDVHEASRASTRGRWTGWTQNSSSGAPTEAPSWTCSGSGGGCTWGVEIKY